MSAEGAQFDPRPPARVALIANPATRGNATSIIATVVAEAPATAQVEAFLTSSPGEAEELARTAAATADLVVAIGGDGTVADVATGILGRGVPLGIVPAGSTNIIAQELRIPNRPLAAARLLFGPHRLAAIDVGRCNGRSFLHMAGAGLDSHFFEQANPTLKRQIGWLAYLPAAAAALRHPPSRFDILADGHRTSVTSSLVLVANGRSIIRPAVHLLPDVRHDDGWLDLLIFSATKPVDIAATLGQVISLGLHRSRFLIRIRARRIEIDAEPRLPLELDGDVVGAMPARISLLPRALSIVAPRRAQFR